MDCKVAIGESAVINRRNYQFTIVEKSEPGKMEEGMRLYASCLATSLYKRAIVDSKMDPKESFELENVYCRSCKRNFYRLKLERQ